MDNKKWNKEISSHIIQSTKNNNNNSNTDVTNANDNIYINDRK